jgi:parvulin-like peptidyl-prolyl isomerase
MRRVVLAAVVLSLAGTAAAEVAERIVAKVNRDIITKTEWDETTAAQLAQSGTLTGAAERGKLAEQVLERMISSRLVIQAAGVEGLKVGDTEVEPQVDQEIEATRAQFPSQREFAERLKAEGVSLENLRDRITRRVKDQFLYFRMISKKQRELDQAVEVTEDDVKAYHEANKDRWQTPSMVKARHIQFSVDQAATGDTRQAALGEARRKLAAAQAALKRGDRFEDVAVMLSDDILTRMNGGDLGTFERGTWHESIENTAFSLKPGQVSKLVESPVGLHLVKTEQFVKPHPKALDEKFKPPAPPPAPGAPVYEPPEMLLKDYIKGLLRNEKIAKGLQAWADGLKARALIQRFPEEPRKQ